MKYSALYAALFFCAFVPAHIIAQAHINHSAQLTIDGKTSHTYTVQFTQSGDTTRRVTSYFDNGKHLVRQETTRFRVQALRLYSNFIEDFRTGELLRQMTSKNTFTVKRRERKGADFEEKSVTADNAIFSSLISERIGQNMKALERGETVSFTLVLPLHGIVPDMNIVKSGNESVNGVACTIIKLDPSNLVFKALMGEPSYFTFETAKPHRFMRYKGILGLPSAEGKQQSGVVVMKY